MASASALASVSQSKAPPPPPPEPLPPAAVFVGGVARVNVTGVRQALVPAFAGAVEFAVLAVTTTGALSMRPESSVTVSSN